MIIKEPKITIQIHNKLSLTDRLLMFPASLLMSILDIFIDTKVTTLSLKEAEAEALYEHLHKYLKKEND